MLVPGRSVVLFFCPSVRCPGLFRESSAPISNRSAEYTDMSISSQIAVDCKSVNSDLENKMRSLTVLVKVLSIFLSG